MKIAKYLIGALLVVGMTSGSALMPPKYLSVPQWKNCVKTVKQGSARFVCLPPMKPAMCPMSSWKRLTMLHEVKPCMKMKSCHR